MKIKLQSILNRKPYVYDYRGFISELFREDMTSRDLTTRFTALASAASSARIVAKEDGVAAGLEIVRDVFLFRDRSLQVSLKFKDGDTVKDREVVCAIKGRTVSILQSERIALNLLQRLSGVATETSRLVGLISGTGARLLDTRKTTPGMRYLEKYAVTAGGGLNHRLNLGDGILIKENHIAASGSLTAAVKNAWSRKPRHILLEVEVKNLKELAEAFGLPVDLIMLDNFGLDMIKEAVDLRNRSGKGKKMEVSGNVTGLNIRAIAETGVDYISVGAITHSARALDFSLLLD